MSAFQINIGNCRKHFAKALEILKKDLKVFAMFDVKLFTDLTKLLALEDFRSGDVRAPLCWTFLSISRQVNQLMLM